ncbi:unnamed protein product, partial [Closterium sp. NIES-53]
MFPPNLPHLREDGVDAIPRGVLRARDGLPGVRGGAHVVGENDARMARAEREKEGEKERKRERGGNEMQGRMVGGAHVVGQDDACWGAGKREGGKERMRDAREMNGRASQPDEGEQTMNERVS